ncbi:MAG: hypothetical protein ACMXYE_05200 [Candidatus Woesearchaeota archaeon]
MGDSKHLLKGLFLVFFISVLFAPVVFADEQFIRIRPINDEISMMEEATFNITLANTLSTTDLISVYSPNINAWTVRVVPDSVTLGPHQTTNLLLRLRPKEMIEPGRQYGVQLNFRSRERGTIQTAFAYVHIKSQEQINREYLPVLSLDIPETLQLVPGEQVSFPIEIENMNIREFSELDLRLSNSLISASSIFELRPLQKKTVQFTLSVDSTTPPTRENLIMVIMLGNQTVLSRSINSEVLEVERISKETFVSESFLFSEHTVRVTNEGNIMTDAEYNIPAGFIKSLFIRSSLYSEATLSDGQRMRTFYVPLQPGETQSIEIIISYRPLLYALLTLIVVVVLYYTFRSPLVIRKSVARIKVKEGSLSELKVLIHVKNRTKRSFEDIIVMDRIPKITTIGKEFEVGTIQPSKIVSNSRKGAIAHWDVSSLDSFEERVITYKLYSNLNILGGMTLPLALLKFKTLTGREKKVTSNKIKLVIQKFKEQ